MTDIAELLKDDDNLTMLQLSVLYRVHELNNDLYKAADAIEDRSMFINNGVDRDDFITTADQLLTNVSNAINEFNRGFTLLTALKCNDHSFNIIDHDSAMAEYTRLLKP